MRTHDTVIETVKAAPPISVAGLTIMGVSVADWALILTIVYTVFLLIDKLPAVVRRIIQLINWSKATYDRFK